MAIIIDGKIYRNLQEQVQKNMDDIEELQERADDGYYTKEESDAKFQTKADMSDYYDKTESDAIFQTKIGMALYATQQQLNLNIAATEARTDNLLNGYIKDNDTNYASTFRGKGVYVKEEGQYTTTIYGDGTISRSIPRTAGYTYALPSATGTLALTSDIPTVPTKTSDLQNDSGFITSSAIPNYTGGSGITINSGNVVSADSTLARVADIPSITGLTMYNYKITISGVDGGTSNTRSAVYIVTLPYQWDYSSLSKIEIIRLIPVWSVVVDTDTTSTGKIMGRFHWQTSAISMIDWVDGTHTVMDFTGSFNATITTAAPAHW